MVVKRKILAKRDATPLKVLLLKAAPCRENGTASITTLANALGVTRARVYQWINRGKMPVWHAEKAAELSDGRVTVEDLRPFVNESWQSQFQNPESSYFDDVI